MAGILLWEKNSLGDLLSLSLQAVQLFPFVTSVFLIEFSVFISAAGGLKITPGVAGSLGLWGAGHTHTPGVGINLLAFGSLFLLLTKVVRVPRKITKGAPVVN